MELENVLCKCGSFCMCVILGILALGFVTLIITLIIFGCKCIGPCLC